MTIFKVLLILLAGVFFENVISYNPLLTYVLRFKRVTMHSNLTGNYTINQYNGQQYLNGYFKLNTKEIIDKVVVIFDRCNTEGINCEYFQSWTLTDICPILKEKNQIWSSLYGAFDPPLVCPLTRESYRINNATIDVNQAIRWYSDSVDYYWKVIQQFFSNTKFLGSYTIELSILGYRKKTKSILFKK